MNTPDQREWHRLFNAALNGQLTEADRELLASLLKSSAEARQLWFLYADNECSLSDRKLPALASTRKTGRSWLPLRSLTAAAAGIVLGIFCTSVVFAYVAPSLGKVVTLLDDSFESGPAPLVTGVPVEPGRWSGDYTEVVGEQQGVNPENGKKMLRFLRADYKGKPSPEGGMIGDLFRLIDMRPYRREFADGGAVVQLSAEFNAFEFPAGERYFCSLVIYALDAETATNGSMRGNIASNEALLGVQQRSIILDRSPATWQRFTSELRLPPDTDFLLVRIFNLDAGKSVPRQTFAGHYLDDVRLTMARRDPMP